MKAKKLSNQGKDFINLYTGNVFRIALIAGILISLAVILTGIASYASTKNALISKTKSQDLVFIVKSMSEKVDSRIQRAMETSYIIARSQNNVAWLKDRETDTVLGETVLNELNDIANKYDYNNTFIASVPTNNYYYREKKNHEQVNEKNAVLSNSNIADKWFYDFINLRKPISLNISFDRNMNDTFLFVNTLMGSAEEPLGVAGIGLSLNELSAEFKQYKVGKLSSLCLIDDSGIIQLSDNSENRGNNLANYVPEEVLGKINNQILNKSDEYFVSEYNNTEGKIIDYSFHKLNSCDWILYYEIPRSESITSINTLKINTFITVILVLLFFVGIFYIVSRKIANPYKQTLLINKELEKKISERTEELQEINHKVMDSINYAKRMQEAILPSEDEMRSAFTDYSIIWKPRDVVGGDFYWLRKLDDTIVIVIGDCTGHGVPGALMTMTVNAILDNLVTNTNKNNPEIILTELDHILKKVLHKDANTQEIDDGLDIGICCIKNKSVILYAGAKIDLYVKNKNNLTTYKSYKRSVGYKSTCLDGCLKKTEFSIDQNDIFILTTDGFLHQNGGYKDYPFGNQHFYDMILESNDLSMEAIKNSFERTLQQYMKTEPQLDDIVLLIFKVK